MRPRTDTIPGAAYSRHSGIISVVLHRLAGEGS
jgi:hypothetical protein